MAYIALAFAVLAAGLHVMIFGNSKVLSGFLPSLFDREMAQLGVPDVESFNFGIPADDRFELVPLLVDLLFDVRRRRCRVGRPGREKNPDRGDGAGDGAQQGSSSRLDPFHVGAVSFLPSAADRVS